MDFLEGFLLGPLWSDTEYETQRHIGFHLFLGALISGGFLWLLIFPDKLAFWLSLPGALYVVFFLLFLFATPFTARMYYQFNLPLKILVLLVQICKLIAVFLFTYKIMLPKYELNMAELPQLAMDEINLSISSSTEFFERFGRTTGMLLGIVGGGLMIVLRLALIIGAAIIVPVLIIYAVRLVQWAWDYFTQRYILRESHR
ncbi:MAG: hypothetical protein PWP10_3154 [Clostridiales bacterium]|jgi:hypothetical protein|nr:hypothetical protein [Eubacteriales bacterium]MDD3198464.1 hypothetical protein [Eubacteriales bacterium]MDD3502814.1 hypothetical protein [Eubacteriales bacterium]MDD4683199.1 hypothetical protein [Eubacteriales bacterium]MDN5314404.1 hypothetical protein [Clostridiales bacterium]